MTIPSLSVRIQPQTDHGSRPTALLAFAELLIGGAFVIKGIRVLARRDGPDRAPFVVFPAMKGVGATCDRWYDIAHPVTAEARAASIAAVLDAWKKVEAIP